MLSMCVTQKNPHQSINDDNNKRKQKQTTVEKDI